MSEAERGPRRWPNAGSLRALAEVAGTFLRLGCVSFGGPVAHLGYLRAECVARRRWLEDAHFADLVALCQFLPGPASSQVVFALGLRRAGLLGAFAASVCFTLPSAVLMIAFAYGVSLGGDLRGAGWLHGLGLASVAVVAQAVWGMGRALCTDLTRRALCLAAAGVVLVLPGAGAQLGVLTLGALVGWWRYRGALPAHDGAPEPPRDRAPLAAAAALVTFAVLLVLLPALARATDTHALAVFDAFYRSGALVFGGGHVVLPLLRAEVVPNGWLSDDAFLAGYGAAQALPGPMFTFAAYLGAAMESTAARWVNGLWCLLAIFLPAWLLVGGALPFWQRLRTRPWARGLMAGANAAVVGVLLAAFYRPISTESLHGVRDVALALGALALLEYARVAPWKVVGGLAAAGHLGLVSSR